MEKDKTDRKKNKASSSQDDQSAPTKPLIVADDTALVSAVVSNTPFELDKNYHTIITPQSHHIPMTPIIHALHNNTTVKTLIISQRIWDPIELREFVRCLASVNKGINKILLQAHDFEPNFMEALTKILKSNRRIKTMEISMGSSTQTHEAGVLRLCDGMEYYHFEELVMTWVKFSVDLFKHFMESLKYNQSIRYVRISGDQLAHALPSLCNTLIANPTITQVSLEHFQFMQSCESLNQVLKLNIIKALNFKATNLTEVLKFIAEGLQANTSMQELGLRQCQMNWKLFGEIFSINKGIKKLNISENHDFTDRQIQYLNLDSNTTLTDLNITNCHNIKFIEPLLSKLKYNKTLKKLAIGPIDSKQDPKILEEFISTNRTLTDFVIRSDYTNHKSEAFKAIADGLEVNRSLRTFSIRMDHIGYKTFIHFIDALKRNYSLLELHIAKLNRIYLNHRPPNGSDIDDIILDLLNTNKTLRYITGADDYPHLAERLKSNRDTQDKIISDTCTLIKMIVMKPHSFILPIEIWLKIFSFVSYDCTPFNFEQFFRKFIK